MSETPDYHMNGKTDTVSPPDDSATNTKGSGLDGSSSGGNNQANPPPPMKPGRRPVACKKCHSLKVKCTPADLNNPAGPCIRCVNSKRECEIDLNQTRKRRRRTRAAIEGDSVMHSNSDIGVSSNSPGGATYASMGSGSGSGNTSNTMDQTVLVSQLQDQIRHLTSELQRAQNQSSTQSQNSPQPNRMYTPPSIYISKNDLESEISLLCNSSSVVLTDLTTSLKETADRRAFLLKGLSKSVDVVSMGLLTIEDATFRLNLYKNTIYVAHPFVEIKDDVTVHDLRASHPYLFNAIMSVTNAIYTKPIELDSSLAIDNAAIQSVTTEVLVAGSKSDELVQSLLLLSLWYNTPELFRHRRYHLLISLSVTMLHDLGIVGKPTYSYNKGSGTVIERTGAGQVVGGSSLKPSSKEQYTLVEYRKLIMILYYSTVSICLILRRTIYVKWTPYVEESCQVLERSGDPVLEEVALFSRLSHQLERIHHIVHAPDVPEYKTSAGQYITSELQKHLNVIKEKINPTNYPFMAFYYSVEAYLHEPMLGHILTSGDNQNLRLSAESIASIGICTRSCLMALETFNRMAPGEIANIPLFYASRIIYTAGMLLRLRYLILSLPSHIEKDMVPSQAIYVIQKLNSLVAEASKIHPCNHFLKKTRLVISLFIQTYATQVQELLRKNGQTPDNFRAPLLNKKERSEMERLNDMYATNRGGGVMTHDSGKPFPPHVPLDILSYAASFRNANSGNSPTSSGLPPPSPRGDLSRTPNPPKIPSPSFLRFNSYGEERNAPSQPTQLSGDVIAANKNTTDNQNDGMVATQASLSGNNGTPDLKRNSVTFNRPSDTLDFPVGNNIPMESNNPMPAPSTGRYLGSILNPNSNFPAPVAGTPSMEPNHKVNLANADQLESSYLALNDEFWVDLLSSDKDRINFSNNINSQITESFFM
ncbi:transcriptional regulator War1p [[Candida] anglica]